MTNWYALDQNGDIISLGAHETFEEADACAKYSPVWVVDEGGAREWLQQLQEILP